MIKSLGLGYFNDEGQPHPIGVDKTDHSDLESVQQPRRTDRQHNAKRCVCCSSTNENGSYCFHTPGYLSILASKIIVAARITEDGSLT